MLLPARYRVQDYPWVGVSFLLDGADAPKRTFNLYERLGCKPGTPIVLRFYARSDQPVNLKVHYGGGKKDSEGFPVEEVSRSCPRDGMLPDQLDQGRYLFCPFHLQLVP